MSTMKERLLRKLATDKGGLTIFFLAALATTAAVLSPGSRLFASGVGSGATSTRAETTARVVVPVDKVSMNGALSRTKIVAGDGSPLYINLEIQTPKSANFSAERIPADVIVILDRSGSMSEANKFPYAKSAIIDLLSRLTAEDRFSLVTFDTYGQVNSYLEPVTVEARSRLAAMVSNLSLGGSTNMSDGLKLAETVMQSGEGGSIRRSQRIILLSDGHANVGDSSLAGLTQQVSRLKNKSGVVSTIGMGLGFNESLLSALADYGMGNYSYLEDLSILGTIFAKDLTDARNMLAERSSIRIALNDGVRLRDAAGYPLEYEAGNPRVVRIPTGQLLGDSLRQITLTFDAPTSALGTRSIGEVMLDYVSNGHSHVVPLASEHLAYEVVEPAKRHEALASINASVWESAWLTNNAGIMQRQYHQALAEGNREKASKTLSDYKEALGKAEAESGVRFRRDKLDKKLVEMDGRLDDAFTGSADEQKHKQNRYAKQALSESISAQRGSR